MDEAQWYAKTLAHWTSSNIEAHDNEGVLGGWGEVDTEDAKGSLAFIQQMLTDGATIPAPITGFRAADCGAGVGRVTGNVLLHVAETVQLVEVSERLLGQAQKQVSALVTNLGASQARPQAFMLSATARFCRASYLSRSWQVTVRGAHFCRRRCVISRHHLVRTTSCGRSGF